MVYSEVTVVRRKSNVEEEEAGQRGSRCCWPCSSCCAGAGKRTEDGVTPDAFLYSQWSRLPWWLFPAFYCLSTLYFSFWLIASWISFKDSKKGKGKWFIFITNWSFATLVLHIYCITVPMIRHVLLPRFRRRNASPGRGETEAESKAAPPPSLQFHFQEVNLEEDRCTAEKTLVVTTSTVGRCPAPQLLAGGPRDLTDRMSGTARGELGFLHRLAWVVDNIAATMAIGVTVAFWSFLYDKSQPVNSVSLHTHGVNAAFVLTDQVLCRRPRRLAHIVHPVAFGLCYGLFSVLYYLCGGSDPNGRHYVYPFLDWTRPLHAFIFTLLFSVLVCLLFVLTYAIYRLRSYVHRRFYSRGLTTTTTDAGCERQRPLLDNRESLSSVCACAIQQEINEFLQIKV